MYRLATLLALLIALAVGCGDSGEDDSNSSSPTATQSADKGADDLKEASKTEERERKSDKDADEEKSSDEDEDEDDDGPKSEQELHEEQEDAFERLPAGQKADLIKTVVRSALLRFGLKVSDVQVSTNGRKVKAIVTRKTACRAIASQEPHMVLAIQEGAPGVHSVVFEVAGTGQELGYYVLNCERPKMPSGEGRVLLEHTAVGGPWTSRVFTIKVERWALEWENLGSSMAGIVVPIAGESKDRYFKPVGSQKPESGRYEYRGSGKFQLKVSGAARWSVRVKEIR
jgi:hypothetical protein